MLLWSASFFNELATEKELCSVRSFFNELETMTLLNIVPLFYKYGTTNNKLGNVFLRGLTSVKMKPKTVGIFFMISPYGLKKRKGPHIDSGSNTFMSVNRSKFA